MDKFISDLPRFPDTAKPELPHFPDKCAKKKFSIVLGNESGDLDSIVCSAVLAYHLTIRTQVQHLPVANFDRRDLNLHTEVLHCFRRLGLDPSKLYFADDVEWSDFYNNVYFVSLVDHNVINNPDLAFLEDKVNRIVDHHVLERSEKKTVAVDWDKALLLAPTDGKAKLVIKPVGSCSTLIAKMLFDDQPDYEEEIPLKLIRWAILTDTSNLSPAAKKTTDDDVEMLEEIERRLKLSKETREAEFREIAKAKSDTSSFDCSMLFRKDMKIIRLAKITVAMSTLPGMSCISAKLRTEFDAHIAAHAKGHALVVLLGSGDALLYPASGNKYCEAAKSALLSANMGIVESGDIISDEVVYLKRNDPGYTRKKILPVIKTAMERVEAKK